MTTKTIAGAYSAGYLLNASYSTVTITSSGSVGGFGLLTQGSTTVENSGRLSAVNGGSGLYMLGGGSLNNASGKEISGGYAAGGYTSGGSGYAGGAAVHALAFASINNSGILHGGQGGVGEYNASLINSLAVGGAGGIGGAGVQLKTNGGITNHEIVLGGAGGTGGNASDDVNGGGTGGTGGAGGAGILAGGGATIVNLADGLYGGVGGTGGIGNGGEGGRGGTGGAGVALNSGGYVYVEAGRVMGGTGGRGGYGPSGSYGGSGGDGVYLKTAGVVKVGATGAIDGGAGGQGDGGPYGIVIGGGAGVYLRAGGTILNHGAITGGNYAFGVVLYDGGEVANYGTISGVAGGGGVALLEGGTVINDASIATGVALYDGGTVFNNGAIAGTYFDASVDGIRIETNGVLVNGSGGDATASIVATSKYQESFGVYAVSGATVTNFGTISGATDAVKFVAATDTLIVEAGCVFNGAVAGGGGTLELADGKGDLSAFNAGGNITAFGATFQNFGTLEIGKMGNFSLTGGGTGDGTVGAGQTLIDAGTLLIDNTLTVNGSLIVSKTLGDVRGAHFPTLAIEGGAAAFNKGTKLDVTFIDVDGASSVNVGTNLAYDGLWSQSAGDLNVTARDNLTFDAVTFIDQTDSFAGTFSGGGGVIFSGGTVSLNGLTLAGAFVDADSASLIVGSNGLTVAAGSSLSLETGEITGTTATSTLTNAGTILASGALGDGQITLVNASGGVIDANTAAALIIDTGVAFLDNVGMLESTGSGGLTVQSPLVNAGQIGAFAGTVTLNGTVSGSGLAQINGGTLIANSAFSQAVDFTGSTGELVLADSRSYTGAITGFSTSGGTELDLKDVGFVKSSEAKFSGTSSGGLLTVKDGSEVATIKLTGDYLSSTFVCSSDGSGGVLIEDPTPGASAPPSPHVLVAAMAAMESRSATAMTLADEPRPGGVTGLVAPRCVSA